MQVKPQFYFKKRSCSEDSHINPLRLQLWQSNAICVLLYFSAVFCFHSPKIPVARLLLHRLRLILHCAGSCAATSHPLAPLGRSEVGEAGVVTVSRTLTETTEPLTWSQSQWQPHSHFYSQFTLTLALTLTLTQTLTHTHRSVYQVSFSLASTSLPGSPLPTPHFPLKRWRKKVSVRHIFSG